MRAEITPRGARRRLGFSLSFRLPGRAQSRIAAGFLVTMFLLAGCISFLHHHHDLQCSTPCPICYAINLPARVGTGLHIPELALSVFAQPAEIHVAWTEPSPRDYPPRAPPA